MLFKVRDLELKPARFEVSFAAGEINFLDDELKQTAPLAAKGVAEWVESISEIHVTGEFSTKLAAPCDRCLETGTFAVAEHFDLYYRPAATLETGEEIEIKDEDEIQVGFFDGEEISLEEILREQVLLALPVQRLCREECKGLCPSCGANRNQSVCACSPPEVENRWGALKDLKISK